MRLAAALGLLLLSGCALPDFLSFPPQVRGNKVDADAMKQLVPGVSTRADVTAAIGSPTLHDTFDDNTWVYIGLVTRPVIAGTNDVEDQQVLALTFDNRGVLQSVNHKGPQDGYAVSMVGRATPAPGNEATILQQLLGNVGRFNPGTGPTAPTTSNTGAGQSNTNGL